MWAPDAGIGSYIAMRYGSIDGVVQISTFLMKLEQTKTGPLPHGDVESELSQGFRFPIFLRPRRCRSWTQEYTPTWGSRRKTKLSRNPTSHCGIHSFRQLQVHSIPNAVNCLNEFPLTICRFYIKYWHVRFPGLRRVDNEGRFKTYFLGKIQGNNMFDTG